MNVLIAVEGCEAHRDRFAVIHDTWGKGWPEVHYLTGQGLDVPDDYLSLPAKTKAICQYSLEVGYDFTLICDTDIYLAVDRALKSGFEQHDYMGYVLDYLPIPYCSGPCYWLSQKACKVLAEANWDEHAVPGHATDEDVMVGAVLHHYGFAPHHDPRYCVSIPPAPDNGIISYHMKYHSEYSEARMRQLHWTYTNG